MTPTTVALASPGDSLCGYRIVRKLGDGPRAEVFLGFGEGDGDEGATAALKICRASSAASAPTELEALARAEHPHVVRLVDAATTPSGATCIVLERLSRGSLAHLLERRETLAAGEAVTILAPLATAVDEVHRSGVVHGAVGAGAVLFRESGAPVLARFGRATLIQPGLSAALLAPLVATDRLALADLASLVLDRVHDARAAEVAQWARESSDGDGFGTALAERLFALATATPVVFDESAARSFAVPGRVPARRADHRAAARTSPREHTARAAVVDRAMDTLRSLRVVRTPVWVGAASVLVAIIAALVLVPGGASDAPANARGVSTPASTPDPTATSSSATSVADPIAALAALIVARRACMDELSVICLDGVDQSGSAALDDDADLIRGVRAGGELPDAARLGAVSPQLVERLGDSALIDLEGDDKPASVLLIRTEAGWRIRDYLD